MSEHKLQAKLFISGKIELKTGLHIGGSSTALDIGGIDSNVIKTAAGVPFIPGSSLKGKMRSLLEKSRGLEKLCADTTGDNADISRIFGLPGDKSEIGFTTRLFVRDTFLDKFDFEDKKESEFSELELEYTEGKWENTIDRANSAANPRQLERVPAGAMFDFNMMYNIYNEIDVKNLETVITGMRLLQDDYLGGSGSRGYGQIEFKNLNFTLKTLQKYETDNEKISILQDQSTSLNLAELIDTVKKQLQK